MPFIEHFQAKISNSNLGSNFDSFGDKQGLEFLFFNFIKAHLWAFPCLLNLSLEFVQELSYLYGSLRK